MMPERIYSFVTTQLKWLLLILSLVGCQPTPDQQLLDSIGEHVIVPSHQQFAISADKLKQTAHTFCQQPNNTHWQLLRKQWLATISQWQAVKLIQFGPISQDNQHWKIQFWPDKHNLIRKKVNALLNATEELNVARIKKASVVVQGLSALEYLLFDNEGGQLTRYTNNKKPRQCQLLITIASHTQEVAAHLNNAWQPTGNNFLSVFTQTGEKNPDFPTNNASIAALVDTLIANLELAKRDQLATPLGYRNKAGKLLKHKPRPYLSEAWRSRSSLLLLQAHLSAAQILYQGGSVDKQNRYGFDHYLRKQPSTQTLAVAISKQFNTINHQIKTIKLPLFEAVNDGPSQQQLERLYKQVTQLVRLLKNNLPTAMGVTLGFNANDGD